MPRLRLATDLDALDDYCRQDPIARLQLGQRVRWLQEGRELPGALLGWQGPEGVTACAWLGQTLHISALNQADEQFIAALTEYLLAGQYLPGIKSISTDAQTMTLLLENLGEHWQPRLRLHQSLYQLSRNTHTAATRGTEQSGIKKSSRWKLRRARPSEFEPVLEACRQMVLGEHDYDPLEEDGPNFSRYAQYLVQQGRILGAFEDDGTLVYKAELGVIHRGIVQLEGVWLAPKYRGQGLATDLIRRTLKKIFDLGADTVCLYVNVDNASAISAYRNVGFMQVGSRDTALK